MAKPAEKDGFILRILLSNVRGKRNWLFGQIEDCIAVWGREKLAERFGRGGLGWSGHCTGSSDWREATGGSEGADERSELVRATGVVRRGRKCSDKSGHVLMLSRLKGKQGALLNYGDQDWG